jgi:anaerobic magnesium-protoporphyrin IX monomethyl ester cyclase
MAARGALDLLLVNPGDRAQIYQSLGGSLAAIEPPIWAGLMAAFIRQRGFSAGILDANAEGLTPEQAAERIAEMAPLLTAIVAYGHNPSASTQVMPSAGAICKEMKHLLPEHKLLLVGGHVASLPQRTLEEEEADFVCSGEGPQTILDLLQALKSGNPDFGKVRDLVFRAGTAIRLTPPAPLVMNLDQDMPGIAWDLLPMEKYRAHNWHCFGNIPRQPYASIYTTLGCPFHCNFCCIQAPFRSGERAVGFRKGINSYRRWSPQSVLAQIDMLVHRYGGRNIKFADEIFVLDTKHVLGICEGIINRGYDLNIWAYARVDSVKEEILDTLRRAGFRWLAFGIESASEKVRGDAQKGFGQEDIFRTLKKVKKAGINIGANYIFGLPEDDGETMQATLDLALELKAEYANFYCAMAYPGSQLFDLALQEGWPLPERWSGYSQYSLDTLPLPTRYLSGMEVMNFRDHAFQVYYDDPEYLRMMIQKFGEETVQQIRQMTSHKLKRNADPAAMNAQETVRL